MSTLDHIKNNFTFDFMDLSNPSASPPAGREKDIPPPFGEPLQDSNGPLHESDRPFTETASPKSENGLYRILAEKSMAGVYVVQDGKFVYVNRMGASYARYEAQELIGTHATALILPEDKEKARESACRMLEGLSSSPYEFRIRTKDGDIRWIMETVTPIIFEGRPAVLGNSMDVTEARLAMQKIERIQQQQKALLDNIPDIAWMKDAEGRYIAVNEAFRRFCGKEVADVIGRSDFEIFPPDQAKRFHHDDRHILSTRRSAIVEQCALTPKDEECWFETVKTPILNDRQEAIGTVGITRDITERRGSEKALRESEARFRLLAENVSDVILLFDPDGKTTYVSPSIEQVLGYSPEEVLKLKYGDVMMPRSLQTVRAFIRQELRDGRVARFDCSQPRSIELELIRKDGAVRWAEINFKMQTDEEGRPRHIVGVLRDIHERKLAELALRESEAKFRALADHTPVGILIHQDNVICYAGREAGRMMGYEDRNEFIGHHIMEFIHEDDRKRIAEIGRRRMADEDAPAQYEARLVRKDGSVIDVLISAMVIEYEGRKSTQAAFIDITEQKKASEALRESESMFRLLTENITDVIVLTGLDGHTLYVSPAIEPMLGYPLDELREKKYSDVMTPQSLRAVKTFLREKVWNGKASQLQPAVPDVMELQVVCRDGSVKDVEIRSRVLLNDAGEPQRILSVMRDVSERRAAERALKESEERLRTYLDSMQDFVFLKDEKSRFLMVNRSFVEHSGIEEREVLGKTDADYYPPEIARSFMDSDRKVVEGKAAVTGEITLGNRCFEWKKFPVNLGEGRTGIGGCVHEITERKAAEAALRESEARFRALADHIPVGVVVHENGRLLYIGAHAAAMFGYDDRETFIGSSVLDFVHEDDRPRLVEIMQRRAAGEVVPSSYEIRLVRKDGSSMDALVHSAVMLDGSEGKVTLTVFADITERKAAEAALRESEARFRALADQTPVGILIHHNGIIQFAGREAGRMMGYDHPDEYIGRSILEFIQAEDRDRVADFTRRRIAGADTPVQYEARLVRKDGSVIDVLISAMVVEYGGRRCTQAAFMDITEHKKAVEAHRQSENKLQALLRAAPIGIGLIRGRFFEWVNEELCRMTGYSPGELRGGAVNLLYPDRQEYLRTHAALRRQMYRKSVGSIETRWKAKDGSVIDVLLRCASGDGRGTSAGIVLTALDITEIKRAETSLRESRQRMSDIINFLPDATCVIDRKGTVIAWNHAMERLTGIMAKDMLGKGNYEYALPFIGRRQPVLIDMAMNPEELIKKSCIRIDKKGDFLAGELRASDAPGKERYLHTIAAPFRDSAGNVTGAIACMRDVTEQKKAEQLLQGIAKDLRKKAQKRARDLNVANMLLRLELDEHRKTGEALRKSEQRYRAIVEDQSEWICRFGSDGKITFVNEAFCRHTGKTFEDLAGCRFSRLFGHDERQKIEEMLAGLDRDHACRTVECRAFVSGGDPRWQLWTLRAIYDERGRFIEYQAVGRDTTDQKLAALQLEESRNMLRSVFDGIADPLMMIGRDLRILMMNRAAIKYYDIRDPRNVLNGDARQRLFKQFGPDDEERILRGIRDKKPLNLELTTAGEPRRFEKVSIYPVPGGSRKEEAVIVRIVDVTKEKILERQSSQGEKLASLGLLVSGLVHEINNPNNFIIFNMPILRDYIKELLPIVDAHAGSQGQYELFQMPYEEFRNDLLTLLNNIEHGAQRINHTIGILSEFTCKRENGELRLTSLSEVIERAVTLCRPQIRSHIRHFQVEIPPDLPPVFTDPASLEQVLVNLVVNAAHACDKEDSRVTLRVSRGQTWQNRFIIEVTDNGCGMDEDMRKKIFEPFFTTKPPGLGMGLGLYMARSQIERIGGQIEVESRPGEGSTFRITLPDADLQGARRIH